MVGILLFFWDGLFSGAMLVSGRVKTLIGQTETDLRDMQAEKPHDLAATELQNGRNGG